MTKKKCSNCGDGLTKAAIPPPGSVTVSTFDDPHSAPPMNSPCVQKWAAEAAAYAALGLALAAWMATPTATTLSAYRNAMTNYLGKWYTTECCLRGWLA